MWICSKCGEYRMPAVVKCNCKEFTILDEGGEEYSEFAMDEEGAALKFAESSNVNGDYYLMNNTAKVLVDGKSFNISAEPDVYYSASEVDNA